MPSIEPIRWCDDHLELLDQRELPAEEIYRAYADAAEVAEAIRAMVVRGAPAIGITAAYGVALAAQRGSDLEAAIEQLAASRPTAVNLAWALQQARDVVCGSGDVAVRLLALAKKIHRDDLAINQRIGDFGAALLPSTCRVYTHCNTGALATGGYGTALGIIRSAHRDGKIERVFAGETRPWWQGARLTCWELMRENIPVSLCVDGAAGIIMQRDDVHAVLVGADRVAANGDVANKVGTYNLAILARHHGVRFMVAAPVSTFDLAIADGSAIPIEQRNAMEVTHYAGRAIAPEGCTAVNPAFGVTPASLIDAIVTELGVIENPSTQRIAAHLAGSTT